MKNTKIPALLAILVMSLFAAASFAQQQRVFNWVPANAEDVRLDPANYHTAGTYRADALGEHNHVDIKAERPVTIFMTPAEDWNQALQHPESFPGLSQVCLREHVVETTYICDLPVGTLLIMVIRDERNNPDAAVFAGLGAVLDPKDKTQRAVGDGIATIFTGQGSAATRRFKAPNDLHIQYYRWDCVENCVQPEFQWARQVKEKYELTSFVKVYGGFVPDHDGEQVSIKIKSPVPMVVAMLPSSVADQLHTQPAALETALQKNACQQRGVQSLEFQCTFNAADGPQSLVVAPEAGTDVPRHKKTEIEMQAARCVLNCALLQTKQQ
ncbi:MAG TPA: hypothetical protein VH114_00470 [Candidatus Acidoferrum sp.]|jgi:hypothetical protein|nr:hypothetical protein [Candidatus Acidoferrum sp.]